jgi:hypothetical protein
MKAQMVVIVLLLAVLLVAVFMVAGQEAGGNQQWEYLFFAYNVQDTTESGLVITSDADETAALNQELLAFEAGDSPSNLPLYFDILGLQGWELTMPYSQPGVTVGQLFIFKRPL